MENSERRAAADARRIVQSDSGVARDSTKEVRKILKRAEDRGRKMGRKEREAELPNANVRGALLQTSVAVLENMEAQTSQIPNSDGALRGYREAIAILRDSLKQDEKLPANRGGKANRQKDVDDIGKAVTAAQKAKKKTPARKAPAKKKASDG